MISVGPDKLYDALMESGEFTTRGILFAFNSDALLPESTPVLADMVRTLESHPELAIVIEGHTDSVGEDAYNLELSERRAASRRWLPTSWSVGSRRAGCRRWERAKRIRSPTTRRPRAGSRTGGWWSGCRSSSWSLESLGCELDRG